MFEEQYCEKINTLNFSCKMHFNETIYGENIQSGQNIDITIDDSVAAAVNIHFRKDMSDDGGPPEIGLR